MKIFSHSKLSTYENCPLQYRYRYLDKLSVEEQTIEAFLGSRVHEALERLYEDVSHARVPSLEDIFRYYSEMWESQWSEKIRIVKKRYGPEDYLEMGRGYLTDFYRRHHPFDRSRTIALEESFLFPLDNEGRYGINGVIDRIALADDGTFEVHDYKTSARLPTQKEIDGDRQLAFYHLGIESRWTKAREIKLIWHFLAHGTEMTSCRTKERLDSLKERTTELIEEMLEREDFPPRESSLCPWCLYRSSCPLFAHQSRVEELGEEISSSEEGVQLVDRYRDLKRRKGGLEDEMESVERKIIAYAEREELEAIVGCGCRVKIVEVRDPVYPRKGEEGREELEALLRQAGRWAEVSSLDRHALSKALLEGGWEEGLIERVRAFEKIRINKHLKLTEDKA